MADRIAGARAEGRAALIAYLPVGHPTVDASIAGMVLTTATTVVDLPADPAPAAAGGGHGHQH